MISSILVVAAFSPDSPIRFYADAFAYAGAKVYRVGPRLFDGYPQPELPPVYSLGLFDKSENPSDDVMTRPVEWRRILAGLREYANFDLPKLLVYVPWGAASDKLPSSLKLIDDFLPDESMPAYDALVHRVHREPAYETRTRKGAVTSDPEVAQRLVDVQMIDPKLGIRAYVEALNGAESFFFAKDGRRAAEAWACGCRLQRVCQDRHVDLVQVVYYPTYQDLAIDVLEGLGFEPGLPRLW